MATIDRKNNRLSLFNAIKSQFTNSNNIVLKFEEFEQLFFSTEESCVSAKPNATDKNGYIKQNNLFDILTKPNRKGKVIKTEFFDPKGNEFFSLKDKVTFVKTYACFDFDWTTKSTTKYCLGATPSNTNTDTTTTNLEDYTGFYKIEGNEHVSGAVINYDETKPDILDVTFPDLADANFGDSAIFQKYSKIELRKVNDLKFDIYSQDKQIKFSEVIFNANKKEFTFKIAQVFTGKGVKVEEPTPTSDTDTTIEKKKDTTVPVEKKKDEIPVVRTNTLRFNNDKKTYVATKKCDDFPFTLGCSNKLIGDLNASLFNGDRKNDVYSDELQNDLENVGQFYNNPNKEITKDIWTKFMNRRIIKETVKKVLKEYIIKK
jgi:hypothetical protein